MLAFSGLTLLPRYSASFSAALVVLSSYGSTIFPLGVGGVLAFSATRPHGTGVPSTHQDSLTSSSVYRRQLLSGASCTPSITTHSPSGQ